MKSKFTVKRLHDIKPIFVSIKRTPQEIRIGKINETLETLYKINNDSKEAIGSDDAAAILLKEQLINESNILKTQFKPRYYTTPKNIITGFKLRASGRKKYHRKKNKSNTNVKKIIADKKSSKNIKVKKIRLFGKKTNVIKNEVD
jgi:hypothetical protein